MNILIIKTGALGDVVRTQFFAKYICEQKKYKIFWLAEKASIGILKENPYIKRVYKSFNDLEQKKWDIIYSLEDSREIIKKASKLKSNKIIGFILKKEKINYSVDTNTWNDMGLFSRHGINKANALKKINKFSHLEIFSEIFKCIDVLPNYKGVVRENKIIEKNNIVVGFNPFAGSRWPNKSLKNRTIRSIIKNLITNKRIKKINCFGFNMQNKEKLYSNHKVNILKTKTIDSFFYAICQCDYIITADSLGVHLAAAAQVPYVCFFGPTSAEEVKTPCTPFINIKSSPPGYCSYKPTQKILGLYSKKITSALHTLIKKCSSKKH